MYLRSIIVLLGTLISGVLINQFHPNGIRWMLLKPHWNTSASLTIVDLPTAFELVSSGEAIAIDVREPEAFAIDHIPGAISLPWDSFIRNPQQISKLDSEMSYIIYCFDPECYEAESLGNILAENGFDRVKILYDGFAGWLEMGFPIEP